MSETSKNNGPAAGSGNPPRLGLWQRLRTRVLGRNGDSSLRDSLEAFIGEIEETVPDDAPASPISGHERVLLGNILKLRHLTAYDVMVPRADIVSMHIKSGIDELLAVMSEAGHSRFPIYRESLDDVIGIVHIKDVLKYAKTKENFDLAKIVRTVLIAAPSMRVLDLLLEMRLSRVHMALVVDEFGGIDGLVTIEDLVEEIVGEIEDEHDVAEGPKLIERPDGAVIADARATIEEFEALAGPVLADEERDEDIDTLGGLVFYLADRVPTRGELILHPASGISFEVMEADPRRVKRLRVRNLPRKIGGA
ncbi:MAG TPA: hemolysin family protein [Kiloniellales bacterium]|jgi:CBS domain containing-hemolysin-like protein